MGNQPVGIVSGFAAAGKVDEAEEWRNNEDLPVAAHSQDPLQVCDHRSHGNLMSHYELTHHVVLLIFEFHNLRGDAITVSLAEGRIAEAVDNDRGLWREGKEPNGIMQ